MPDSRRPQRPDDADVLSYEAFGRAFFRLAVTRERVAKGLSNLTGNRIEFGPRNIGPVALASVSADGAVGEVQIAESEGEQVAFRVTIPIRVRLDIRLAGQNHRFDAEIRAHLTLIARAARPLRIFIDIPEPTRDDVEVRVEAQGLRASVLNIVADVEGELQRYVARYITRELDKPAIREQRDIDVAARLDRRASN